MQGKDSLKMQNLINVIHYINTIKEKSHMIISIDTEKTFGKIQHASMIKKTNTQEIRNTGKLPQHNKIHIRKTHSEYNTQW